MSYRIVHSDCIQALKAMPDNSVDSIITDPPYGIGFMGKEWDTFSPEAVDEAMAKDKRLKTGIASQRRSQFAGTYDKSLSASSKYQDWCYEWAKECLRVLKPGAHLLASNSSRMYHRMASAIEDAGFEIRDQIMWIYATGFPKSLNIGKAIDKLQGNKREIVGKKILGGIKRARPDDAEGFSNPYTSGQTIGIDTRGNSIGEGWGTALKPAHEPIVVARKPLIGTVAENVLKYGTGGMNIDGCRIGAEPRTYDLTMTSGNFETTHGGKNVKNGEVTVNGRFPANIIFDEEAGKMLDEQSGISKSSGGNIGTASGFGNNLGGTRYNIKGNGGLGDKGGASRFFYCAKASKSERNIGLDGHNEEIVSDGRAKPIDNPFLLAETERKNIHPTVKPIKLMEYLIKLVTPPNGTVLDPFTGSGSTGCAAVKLGFNFIGIEKEEQYVGIAEARIVAFHDRTDHSRQETLI